MKYSYYYHIVIVFFPNWKIIIRERKKEICNMLRLAWMKQSSWSSSSSPPPLNWMNECRMVTKRNFRRPRSAIVRPHFYQLIQHFATMKNIKKGGQNCTATSCRVVDRRENWESSGWMAIDVYHRSNWSSSHPITSYKTFDASTIGIIINRFKAQRCAVHCVQVSEWVRSSNPLQCAHTLNNIRQIPF